MMGSPANHTVKSKLRVRRLTLPPATDTREEHTVDHQDNQAKEEQFLLEKEQLSRVTELAIRAGQGNHQRPNVHGTNQGTDCDTLVLMGDLYKYGDLKLYLCRLSQIIILDNS
jgi:hypothetical protein